MKTALVIVDMQMMMQDRIDSGRDHVNPDAAANITVIVDHFRKTGQRVVHVRHCDDTAGSPLHPDAPSFQPMPCAIENDGEPIFIKTTSSAFASTELETWLRSEDITDIVMTGAVASFCVNSAVRAGCDLGFNMHVVRDGVIDFDLPDAGLEAKAIFDVTMGLLEADFAEIVTTSALIENAAVDANTRRVSGN